MHETTTITITADAIKAIAGTDADRNQVIKTELYRHLQQISALLTAYHWDERGIVHSLVIDEPSISINEVGTGAFKVRYGTNIHYGCSDKDVELTNSMIITIQVDMTNATAQLTGETVYEREPDEL